jgi:hypothetical protein
MTGANFQERIGFCVGIWLSQRICRISSIAARVAAALASGLIRGGVRDIAQIALCAIANSPHQWVARANGHSRLRILLLL